MSGQLQIIREEATGRGGCAEPFELAWIERIVGRAMRRQVVVLAVRAQPPADDELELMAEAEARRRRFLTTTVSTYRGVVGRIDSDIQLFTWGWHTADEADLRLALAAARDIAADTTIGSACGLDVGIAMTSEVEEPLSGLGLVGAVIGSATALAARAGLGEVLASGRVHRLLEGTIDHLMGDAASVENETWKVPLRSERRQLPGPSTTIELVGRSAELARLEQLWRTARAGQCTAALLVGEAGIGKTAVVDTLLPELNGAGALIVIARGLPETRHIACQPLRTLVGGGGRVGTSSEVPEADDAAVDQLLSSFARLIDLTPPDTEALARALQALIATLSASRPLAVVFEDLHDADEVTQDVVARLGCMAGRAAHAIVIATTRVLPERNRWLAEGWLAIDLPRLLPQDVERIVISAAHGSPLASPVRARVVEIADGVPLQACELARICERMSDLELHPRLLAGPSRLNPSLAHRLDRLAGLKPVAQAAAVLGRQFDSSVLAAALEVDVRTLEMHLETLARLGILTREPGAKPGRYRFPDALLWSYSYCALPRSRRRSLHRRMASQLAGELGIRLACAPELVARHWSQAAEPARSYAWWSKAARMAAERGSAANAAAYANKALSVLRSVPKAGNAAEEAMLTSLLGVQLEVLAGNTANETMAAYRRAVEIAGTVGSASPDLDLETAWRSIGIQLARGDLQGASITSSRLVADAAARGRDDMLVLGQRALGLAHLTAGRIREAIDSLRGAVSRYDPRRHGTLCRSYVSDPGAVALAHLAVAHALAGNHAAADYARRRAIALAAAIGHTHTTASVFGELAVGAMHAGEPGLAASLAQAGKAVAAAHGHRHWERRCRLVLAWTTAMRDPGEGLATMEDEVARHHMTDYATALSISACRMAEIALRSDRPARALELLTAHNSQVEPLGEWLYTPESMRLEAIASVALFPDRRSLALPRLEQAEALARCQGSILFAARAMMARTELQHDGRRSPQAVRRARSPVARRTP